jgi:PAS domain S-box-containing protein
MTPEHSARGSHAAGTQSRALVFDHIRDAVVVLDAGGRITDWNAGAEQLLGWKREETVGRTPEFLDPEWGNAAESEKEERELRCKDGLWVVCIPTHIPLRDTNGATTGHAVVFHDVTDQRELERRLAEERHQLLRSVIEAIEDPVYFKDCDGTLLLANSAWQRIAPPDVLPSPEAPRHPAFGSPMDSQDLTVLQSGKALVNREDFLPSADGAGGWYLISRFPLCSQEGKVIGLIGVARDITGVKRAAEELERTRKRLLDHMENSPLAVIEWDADFCVQHWGGRAEQIFGWKAEEVVGRHFSTWNFVHPDDADRVARIAAELINGNAKRNQCENRNLHRDGRIVHCLWQNSALRDEDGRIISLLSLVEDVTERVEAEQAVAKSERLYHTLVEATRTGYVVIDSKGRVLEANEEYVRLTGRGSLDAIRGRSIVEWTALHDIERNRREVARTLSTGFVHNLEIDYIHPDGRVQPIEVNAHVVETEAGLQIISLCRDISQRRALESEQRNMERRLLESQKLESLGLLAGGVAHDFNNLLTGILGNSSLLAADIHRDSPLHPLVSQIETAAMRAAELCRQMLAYAGKGHFVVQPVDVNAVIEETTGLVHASISKRAQLSLDLHPGLPAVSADPSQIQQVVMNLVINASESLGEQDGTITVRTRSAPHAAADGEFTWFGAMRPEGECVVIEVSDTGCGMSPQTKARIFDPFFTTKFTGRGLGLAAVVGIVRAHGGSIAVESEPGLGTRIRVMFPVGGTSPRPNGGPEGAAEWRGSGTVLLADDEDPVRHTTARLLDSFGFDVVTVRDGREAVRLFCEDPDRFRVVLLDLTMPHMGGPDALAAMRAVRPGVVALLTSGFDEREVLLNHAGTGFAAFLQKPYRGRELRAALRAALAPRTA